MVEAHLQQKLNVRGILSDRVFGPFFINLTIEKYETCCEMKLCWQYRLLIKTLTKFSFNKVGHRFTIYEHDV